VSQSCRAWPKRCLSSRATPPTERAIWCSGTGIIRVKVVLQDRPRGRDRSRAGFEHATATSSWFQDADLEYDVKITTR